jgi:hypothetical protein
VNQVDAFYNLDLQPCNIENINSKEDHQQSISGLRDSRDGLPTYLIIVYLPKAKMLNLAILFSSMEYFHNL